MGVAAIPKQENWIIAKDNAPEPTVTFAAENTPITLVPSDLIARLRQSVKATGNNISNQTWALQYSTDQVGWAGLGPTKHWDYQNGQATDGGTTTTFLTTDGNQHGKYHENGTGTETIVINLINEIDTAIGPTKIVDPARLYYFRALITGAAVALDTGKTYAQITSAWTPLGKPLQQPIPDYVPEPDRPLWSIAKIITVVTTPAWVPFKRWEELQPEPLASPDQRQTMTSRLPDTSWRPLLKREQLPPPEEARPDNRRFQVLPDISWRPLTQKQAPGPPEPPQPDMPPRFDIAALFNDTHATVWFPFRQYWRVESFDRSEEKPLWSVAKFPFGLIPIPFPLQPGIIPWDEIAVHIRYRRHERAVSDILNSLIFQKMMGASSAGVWETGYVAANPLHWQSNPPATVGDALDRIANLAAQLAGQGA